ncbi:MAG: AraC family transcriptional regulator [Acidobacteriota bacterium]|jgi:AraC family transcriptional regulator|nr:AraC family transcriptional regulator [Acidobacteriota bacterium]
MSPAEPAADKIYARPPHFSVHFRSGRRLRWTGGARTDYAVLLLLGGRMRWHVASADSETPLQTGTAGAFGVSGEAIESGDIDEGAALLAAPGDTLSAASASPAEYVLISLSPVYVLDCAARVGLARSDLVVTFRTRAVEADARLARLARDLVDELRGEEAGQELVVGALVEQALVHLLRRYANLRRSAQLELSRAGLVDRRIRLAVELMHAHMHRDLSLEEIASAAHLSPFHFARLFKKLTGATPHAYHASLRAARAQVLLAETDLAITEVGARVGYMSSSHFAKAFRQATGISPRAYRKALVRG